MIALWLTGVNPQAKVKGIRALRIANTILGGGADLSQAKQAWEACANGNEVQVGLAKDIETVNKAGAELRAGGCNSEARDDPAADFAEAAERAMNEGAEPEPPQLSIVQDAGENRDWSDEAAKITAVLLVMTDGSPTRTWMTANTIVNILPNDQVWQDVRKFLQDTFPDPPPNASA